MQTVFRTVGFERVFFWIVSVGLIVVVFTLIPFARPNVMFDEYLYSSSAFHNPEAIPTGGFLYSYIYSLGGFCGANAFYDCGRYINLLFLAALFVGLFSIARLYLEGKRARWLALGVTMFPMSIWVYLFMPEMMHIALTTFVFLLLLVARMKSRTVLWLLVAAIVLGLAASVKVHSLFVLPAFAAIVFLISGRKFSYWWNRAGITVGFIIVTVATKLGVGYLLVGERGLSLLGEYQGAVDRFLDMSAGSSVTTPQAPQGGFYFGLEDQPVDSPPFGFADFPWLLANQLLIVIPIVLIAFGWIFLTLISFREEKREEGPASQALSDAATYALLLFLNALGITVGFNVFATILGDDHTQRALFRYMEFSLLLLSLISIILLEKGVERERKSAVAKFRPWLIAITIAFVVFGNQSQIGPGYADSSFVPLMGAAFVWIPILLAGLGFGYFAYHSKGVRKYLGVSIIVLFASVGVLSHYFYIQATSQADSVGFRVGQYLLDTPSLKVDETLLLSRTTPSIGTAVTEAMLEEFRYALVLGNNPVDLNQSPQDVSDFIGVGNLLYTLDDGYAWVDGVSGSYDVFSRSQSGSMLETLPLGEFDAIGDFEFYGNQGLYSSDGEVNLVFEQNIQAGSSVEICFLAPIDLQNRVLELSISGSSTKVQLSNEREDLPQCFTFGFAEDIDSDKISIKGDTFTNELADGTTLSRVSFGIASVSLTRS